MDQLKTIVIDNGTGYTKMGYAGNLEPSHFFPTAISTFIESKSSNKDKYKNDELDFFIGNEAI